ncbi:hypothetical protein J6590_013810 [Homalodisca vitripennis]|nr:hypothetical protein J6590_013810 [Homalodisca vitripennis]
MRAVSRSLSIVAQVQGISEGAVYDTERWMVRRPEEEEFRAAAPAAWEETRERWMVRRPEEEFRAVAPAAWEEIRSILADLLYETATRMEEDSRRRNTAVPSNGSTPATQPREVSCPVCFANLPTIALRLCGHTLCRPCSNRVGDRCPTCRELIVGRFTIYLPRFLVSQDTSVTDVEHILVSDNLPGLNILVGAVYTSPNSSAGTYFHFYGATEEANTSVDAGSLMVITGDFNDTGTDWEKMSFPEVSPAPRYLVRWQISFV